MKAIIIGAGRGRRLEHLTEELPKTLVPILGRPMLEGILDSLCAGGFGRGDTVFIGGYRAEAVRARYPDLLHVTNREWESNNILLSLLCAREHMSQGFVSTYADILYVPDAITRLVQSPHDITLVCDTEWRRRYQSRTEHPESDAEKLRADGERVLEISRRVAAAEATGEFIGVMRLTRTGAERFIDAFDRAVAARGLDTEFHEGRSLRKAYLIDLLQRLNEQGQPIHCVCIPGGYMEIDTTEDARMAAAWWRQ